MDFRILFSLEATHAFHDIGTYPDVAIDVTDETMQVLRGARILARRHEDRLHFLFEKGEEALLPDEGAVLRFVLTGTDPAFAIFTALPFTPGDGIFLYRNGSGQTAFDPPLVARPAGSSFSHRVALDKRPLQVKLETTQGETVETITVAEKGEVTLPFRLSRRPPGAYRLTETAAGKKAETLYYLDDGLRGKKPFAIAEIKVGTNWPDLKNPPALKVALAASEDWLTYYIVGEKCLPADMAALTIKDAGFAEQNRKEVIFSPPADLDDLAKSLVEGRDAQVAIFRSTNPVPRTATARKKIQLRKKTETFIANLPQPTATAPTTSVIFHFTKG